jgi:probable F420-dependent oxidoreductase
MQVGAIYPQIELGGDPVAVGELARAVERLGYRHLVFYDHVLGAEHDRRDPPLNGPYTEHDPFHDPLVVFGYLAAITERIELATGVLILPQRQTALVARQVADADLLSSGRVRLGVGAGWNHVEYDALGQDFTTRGARLDEQIGLLRRLWDEPLVDFEGRFDRVERAAIVPRPGRRIPIWIGGFSEPGYRRGGRLGDGYSFAGDVDTCIAAMGRVRHHLAENGRTADGFGFELNAVRAKTPADIAAVVERWAEVGGTHFAVTTMRHGFTEVDQHIDHLAATRAALTTAGF